MGTIFRTTEASTTRRRKKTRINEKMAFLVKYIAFVATFLSACSSSSADPPEFMMVDASNVASVKEYADFVAKEDCFPFDPLDTSLIDASGLDADTLYKLLVLRHTGSLIEVCIPKDGDRWFNTFI